MSPWKAYIVDEWSTMSARLAIFRPRDDFVDVVTPTGIETFAAHHANESELIEIPWDALEPLRSAIDERLGRRPDERVTVELRDSLGVERARVDRLIDKALSPPIVIDSTGGVHS